MMLTDSDNNLSKEIQLNTKESNQQLSEEYNLSQVLSIKEIVESKKMLDIHWKLYRFPGESLEDIKNQLLHSLSKNAVKRKTEVLSNDEECSEEEFFINDKIKNSSKIINTLAVDSDSEFGNISYFIKQGHMNNNDKIVLKNKSKDITGEKQDFRKIMEDLSKNEKSEEVNNMKCINNISIRNRNFYKEEDEEDDNVSFDYNYEAPCLLADFLEIEIIVNDTDNILIQPESFLEIDTVMENINWTFEKISQSYCNSLYHVPQVKQFSNQHFPKYRKVAKRRIRKTQKLTKAKATENDINNPIICNMYGIRTINSNYHQPQLQKTNYIQSSENLTDTSEDCDGELKNYENKITHSSDNYTKDHRNGMSNAIVNQEDTLELSNKLSKDYSSKEIKLIDFCYKLDLSNSSSEVEFDTVSQSIANKKKTFVLEGIKSNYPVMDNIDMASIERSDKISSLLILDEKKLRESKITVSMTSTEPVVDLSTVKVKKSCLNLEDLRNANVVMELKENDGDNHSVDIKPNSSSSSSTSSGSGSGSSSSSNSSSSSSSCSCSYSCSRSSCFEMPSKNSLHSNIENNPNSIKIKNEDL
jgi:hypothetical protein